MDRSIEASQIRLVCSAFGGVVFVFILRKSTVHRWALQPNTPKRAATERWNRASAISSVQGILSSLYNL